MDVMLKQVPAVRVAAVRDIFNEYKDIYGMFDEVDRYLRENGLALSGPRVALFYDTIETDRDIEGTAAIPLPDDVTDLPEVERLIVDELPAEPMLACLVHSGDLAHLDESYAAILDWLLNNQRVEAGPRRLILHEDGTLELQVPAALMEGVE